MLSCFADHSMKSVMVIFAIVMKYCDNALLKSHMDI